ncbi:MAG: hypothetical protein JRF50_02015 [Deltaproteobacteria bacterium]|nr:hypothetical protein [Deltaproteobacteria bacterium]
MSEHLKTFEHKKRNWAGKSMPRKEDLQLLTGRGTFMDDIRLPDMKCAATLRSPYPHAGIRGINVSEALNLPGVRRMLTGEDIAKISNPFPVGIPVKG